MKKVDTPKTGQFFVLPLRNNVLFPGQSVPLFVGRKMSLNSLRETLQEKSFLVCVTQKEDRNTEEPRGESLFNYGTLAKIESAKEDQHGNFQVLVTGLERVHVHRFHEEKDKLQAEVETVSDVLPASESDQKQLMAQLRETSVEILELLPYRTDRVVKTLQSIEDLVSLTHVISQHMDLSLSEKQALLEQTRTSQRASELLKLLQERKEKMQLQNEITLKVSQKMGKQQREAFLREQIRALQEELDEYEGKSSQQDYEKKIEEAGMPPEAKELALEQWRRLESIPPHSPENHVIKSHLDLLISLPWDKSSSVEVDLDSARKILNEDHYGLEDVKKRILQHLAVIKLRGSQSGSFLLLVGPPGVGKTSLGQSVAKALGRKYVRASLGGVRDDAEIRGHRRTYVGAIPGRIIEGIKRAGEKNPVFVLDEIDKLARGFSGDPGAALLEVLDPEQNDKFMDHYLDTPFDLSEVMFIATANSLDGIPRPLLDRMEIIDVTGYTHAEKKHIALRHLIPKQWEKHGLKEGDVEFQEDALDFLISHYTREAGVRELQRRIAAIARGLTEKVLTKEEGTTLVVDKNTIIENLGPEKFLPEMALVQSPPGVVTGLAWTPMGGEILLIESNQTPGKGLLTLTGQLGEVMQESAKISLTLVKSHLAPMLNLKSLDSTDFHVHVPAGAIPKDGPSAGITILTALASLLTDRPVDPTLAMTGEVTLRGAVLPVGGIKEKLVAAHRAGIKEVIMSKQNERDLFEVPEEVKKDLSFHFVERAEEVMEIALGIKSKESSSFSLPDAQPPATQGSGVAPSV